MCPSLSGLDFTTTTAKLKCSVFYYELTRGLGFVDITRCSKHTYNDIECTTKF